MDDSRNFFKFNSCVVYHYCDDACYENFSSKGCMTLSYVDLCMCILSKKKQFQICACMDVWVYPRAVATVPSRHSPWPPLIVTVSREPSFWKRAANRNRVCYGKVNSNLVNKWRTGKGRSSCPQHRLCQNFHKEKHRSFVVISTLRWPNC
ncbi:hypothetical protein RJT34_00560 [Clitoria ternatea]|uniref:Uncharacterized protein n=1 Tax=Clitoria ternatea TaxID=43366 RepID=A0AAN9PY39_CLITE